VLVLLGHRKIHASHSSLDGAGMSRQVRAMIQAEGETVFGFTPPQVRRTGSGTHA
jgi:hypothetical protein